MADIDGMFPSKWVKASDIGQRRVTVRMSHVAVEEVGQKKEKRPVLYFQGTDKGLVLNVTNATAIKEIAGSNETNDWHGKQIALYVAKVQYGGKMVDGIRVDYPGTEPTRPAPVTHMRPAPPVVAAPMTPLAAVAEASPFLPVEETFATGPDLDDSEIPF